MSAEDCILYRKIDADWWILPHAFTYDDWDERPDDDLKAVAWKLPEHMDVFATLSSLAEIIKTEHGILYSCPYKSDAPPEVPGGHKWLLSSDFERPEYVKAREEHKANFRGEVFVNHEMCACGCSTTTGATEWCKKKNAEIARKAFAFSSKEKLEAAYKEAREGPSACVAAYDGGPITEFSSGGPKVDITSMGETGPVSRKYVGGKERCMFEPIQSIQAGKQLAQIEAIMVEAITNAIGDDWTMEELTGRCQRLKDPDSQRETFTLDGKPFLEMWPAEFSESDNVLKTTRNYRVIDWGPAAEEAASHCIIYHPLFSRLFRSTRDRSSELLDQLKAGEVTENGIRNLFIGYNEYDGTGAWRIEKPTPPKQG